MSRRRLTWTLLGIVAAASCGSLRRDAEGEIRSAVAKYAKSIDDADTNLAAEVWETSPNVSFLHPGGHEHGWDEVKRNIYEQAMRGMFAERKLSVRDVHVRVYGDAAWADFYWHFVAKLRKDGSQVETWGRETQVYHRGTGGRWALVHVHYSAMPVTGSGGGL